MLKMVLTDGSFIRVWWVSIWTGLYLALILGLLIMRRRLKKTTASLHKEDQSEPE